MAESASSMACNCRGGPTCCARAGGVWSLSPFTPPGDWSNFNTSTKKACVICRSMLHEVAAHLGSTSQEWPRYHQPSGECEQYGPHQHYPDAGIVIWERPETVPSA